MNPGIAILSVSADAVVHVIRLSLLCFGLSDKQLMPRVSTSVAIASLGDLEDWKLGTWYIRFYWLESPREPCFGDPDLFAEEEA